MKSTSGASASANALGALQRQPLGGQLAEHDRDVGDHRGDRPPGRCCRRPRSPTGRSDPAPRASGSAEGLAAEGGRQEAGQRDPDLHRGQEPVRVLVSARATVCPRLPRWASCLTWLSRSETSAISAAAKTPPTTMKTMINETLRTTHSRRAQVQTSRDRRVTLRKRSDRAGARRTSAALVGCDHVCRGWTRWQLGDLPRRRDRPGRPGRPADPARALRGRPGRRSSSSPATRRPSAGPTVPIPAAGTGRRTRRLPGR